MKSKFALLLVLSAAAAFACGCARDAREIPINEQPMYGNREFNEREKQANEIFLKEIIQASGGSREAALKYTLQRAWQELNQKRDPATAMKRFNQAWLLDPNNAQVYYGFGFLMSVQNKPDEAIPFYKKSLEIDPNRVIVLTNLARVYYDQAQVLYRRKRQKEPDQEVKNTLRQALLLYERSAQISVKGLAQTTTPKEDLAYLYYQWAVALEFNGEYEKAWEKIELVRQQGGDALIEPGFLKELSGFMPEPAHR